MPPSSINMYYLLYGLFYLLSLIPWWFLYLVSDFIYVVLYYLAGYRKDVVMSNINIAFPTKTEAEKIRIAKEFYKNFIDTFIETVKLFSISDKAFTKRMTGNFGLLADLHKTGKNVQLNGGHFFNWEYINWGLARNSPYPLIGLYAPLSNKSADRLMYNMRSRYKTLLLNAYNFRTSFHDLARGRYAMALAADQNPPSPEKSFWIDFFGRPTAFFMGPEKGAKINNLAVVFVNYYKVKRGYYNIELSLVTTEPKAMPNGELTARYVAFLEDCIRKRPSNYLWSHRRWKHEFKEEFSNNIIARYQE